MNVGSLFSGVGGLDLGLQQAGWGHVFFCESDEYRRRVLAERFPGVPVHADVRDVGCGERPGGGSPDLIAGGFPCQDLSVAGQRKGLAEERSSLFFEFARIADTLRPELLLVENVPGLLSSNGGRDFGILLGTLADIGYGVAWRILDSRFFGVPQRRRRVFIVGVLAHGDPARAAERAGAILAVGEGCDRHLAKGGEAGQDAPVASQSGLGTGGPDDNDGQQGRLVVSTLGTRVRHAHGAGETLIAHSLTSQGHDASEDGTGRGTPIVAAPLSHGSNPNSNMAGRRREDDENLVAFLPTGGGAKGLSVSEDIAPGTGTGTGGTVAVTFTSRGREGGQQIATQEDGLHPALRSGRGGGRRDSGVAGPVIGIRRLTPIECERLQALPDGWTEVPAGAPDSRRYAALGDTVTASVAEWVGRRLLNAASESREAAQ